MTAYPVSLAITAVLIFIALVVYRTSGRKVGSIEEHD